MLTSKLAGKSEEGLHRQTVAVSERKVHLLETRLIIQMKRGSSTYGRQAGLTPTEKIKAS